MAVLTNWMWQNINRAMDYTSTGSGDFKRNNWTMTRYRITDADYSSQLDQSLSSISAYNGGLEEAISSTDISSESFIKFDAATAWTTTSMEWITTGRIIDGQPTYRPNIGETNIPDNSKVNVCWIDTTGADTWVCVELTEAQADSLSWDIDYSSYTNFVGADLGDDGPIVGTLFENNIGTFTGDARAIQSSTTAKFFCTADNQVYQQASVSWYTQVQTWIYKDSWTAV